MISITNWASEYENHRSRELANPRWVAMTNRLGHDDLLDLLETDDGLAHLGLFTLLVWMAQRSPERGKLLRSDGRPHTAATIARQLHMNLATVQQGISYLANDLGWISDDDPQSSRAIPAQTPREPRGDVAQVPREHRADAAPSSRERRANVAETPRTGIGIGTGNGIGREEETATNNPRARSDSNGEGEGEQYAVAIVQEVQKWLSNHAYASGLDWEEPDQGIAVAILSNLKPGESHEAIRTWLEDLHKRRRKPEQSYAWYVTLAKTGLRAHAARLAQHVANVAALPADACPTCGQGGGMHLAWCGMVGLSETLGIQLPGGKPHA